jgi:hypothetical protein
MPLRWNIPFGVLMDNILSYNYELPINIIAHFSSFKEDSLVRYKGIDSIRFYYKNSLKEANTIKFSSSKIILDLPTEKTNTFFDIVCNNGVGQYKEFWKLNKKLIDESLDKIK